MVIQAVIFDMDGLLMDSERVGLHVMHECGLLQGYDIPIDMVRHTLGANKQFASDYYHETFPELDTEKLFVDFKNALCDLSRQGKIPLKAGARELLDALKSKKIPMAVASSSSMETIQTYLESVGVISYFDALVTGRGFPSKPAPDIFLEAARELHASPENCLVLEDSAYGVQAGRNAGMTVCMIPDLIPFSDSLKPYCDHVLSDLAAVIPLLNP